MSQSFAVLIAIRFTTGRAVGMVNHCALLHTPAFIAVVPEWQPGLRSGWPSHSGRSVDTPARVLPTHQFSSLIAARSPVHESPDLFCMYHGPEQWRACAA